MILVKDVPEWKLPAAWLAISNFDILLSQVAVTLNAFHAYQELLGMTRIARLASLTAFDGELG